MSNKLGSLVIDLAGKELSAEERDLVAHPLIGGVILFSRNYESTEQIKMLCREVRLTRKNPLLIMVDQEGGRVQRFHKGFTRLPSMAMFGKLYDQNAKTAINLAINTGWLMAVELFAVGIDLSLAPVLDLNKNINSATGDRAFHADPSIVTHLAIAFIEGMKSAGMAATGKHFPGHGSVTADSHQSLPIDTRSLAEISQIDMQPFAHLIKAGISAIMPAHIVFPKVDNLPVCFSERWLKKILRKQLNFENVIFSDDLNMEGANISSNYNDRFNAARQAGCDFILLCNNRAGVIQVIDNIAYASHQLSPEKWGRLQARPVPSRPPLKEDIKWQTTHHFLNKFTDFFN